MNKSKRFAFGISTVIAVVILAVAAFDHAAIAHQLHSWKLLPEPERLTELYFTNATNLPTTYRPDQTQDVQFAVHNLEHRITSYNYVISARSVDNANAAAATLAHASFTLVQNQTTTLAAPVTLPNLGAQATITITLQPGNVSINYMINEKG